MHLLSLLLTIGSSVVFLGSQSEIDALQDKYGVSIERNWLGYRVSTFVHESYPEIVTLPLSSTPAEINKQLEKISNEKMNTLEKDYSIHISKTGTTNETAYGQMHQTATKVPVRAPKLGELFILEYALQHSKPSQLMGLSKRSAGVNIYFLNQKHYMAASEWGFDSKGKPSIFLEAREGITFGHSLEENLMHQLSHNSEYRMGWNPFESWKWPMASKLGWVFAGEPMITDYGLNGNFTRLKNTPSGWLIKSIEGPDYLYKQSGPAMWTRCDLNMRPLDFFGKPVADSLARKLSSEKIRQFALIAPVSADFPTPPEVFADALAMFRADKDARAELFQESPILYKIVRDQDQKELDVTYGKGLKVRSVDGTVCDPSPEVLKEIQELEKGTAS